MTRKDFDEYIGHFNNADYDKAAKYLAEDFTLEYFDNPQSPESETRTVRSPQEYIEQYKGWAKSIREVLEIGCFLQEGNSVFVEVYTEFHFLDDVDDFLQPMKKGDVFIMTNWVLYDLKDGKIGRARVAHFRMHDPATAKYLQEARRT